MDAITKRLQSLESKISVALPQNQAILDVVEDVKRELGSFRLTTEVKLLQMKGSLERLEQSLQDPHEDQIQHAADSSRTLDSLRVDMRAVSSALSITNTRLNGINTRLDGVLASRNAIDPNTGDFGLPYTEAVLDGLMPTFVNTMVETVKDELRDWIRRQVASPQTTPAREEMADGLVEDMVMGEQGEVLDMRAEEQEEEVDEDERCDRPVEQVVDNQTDAELAIVPSRPEGDGEGPPAIGPPTPQDVPSETGSSTAALRSPPPTDVAATGEGGGTDQPPQHVGNDGQVELPPFDGMDVDPGDTRNHQSDTDEPSVQETSAQLVQDIDLNESTTISVSQTYH